MPHKTECHLNDVTATGGRQATCRWRPRSERWSSPCSCPSCWTFSCRRAAAPAPSTPPIPHRSPRAARRAPVPLAGLHRHRGQRPGALSFVPAPSSRRVVRGPPSRTLAPSAPPVRCGLLPLPPPRARLSADPRPFPRPISPFFSSWSSTPSRLPASSPCCWRRR